MESSARERLRAELGPSASGLPDLSGVPEPALAAFVEALRSSKKTQKKLLADSAEHSLRLVPALLRPAVKRVLFG